MRYVFTPTSVSIIKKQAIASVDKNVEKLECSYIARGNVKCTGHFGKYFAVP